MRLNSVFQKERKDIEDYFLVDAVKGSRSSDRLLFFLPRNFLKVKSDLLV